MHCQLVCIQKHTCNSLASFALLAALIGLVGATAFHFNKVDPMSAQLLYPYLAWLGYAGAINLYILKNNGAGKKQL